MLPCRQMRVGEPLTARDATASLAWPIRRAAALFGDAEAVVDGQRRLSYRELADRISRLVGALCDGPVAERGRVGFLGVNSTEHLECWFAVPVSGRVLVDMNLRLAPAELEFIVNDCAIQSLVVDAERLELGRELRDRCPSLTELVLIGEIAGRETAGADVISYDTLLRHERREDFPAVAEGDLAGICYTGGTTGAPKGVMLSHRNLLANAMHNVIATGHSDSHRWLHVAPMFHVAGTANVFACAWAGSRQVILPRFEPRSFIDTVRRESVTHCVLVPTMISMLLDELERDESGAGLPSMRHMQYAASPIIPALQRRLLDRFDFDIAQFYGMTEAAPTVTHLSPADHRLGQGGQEPYASRLGSIGTPVIGVEAVVIGSDGEELPPGDVGELCVRGPNVMLGYWNREETTNAALSDGWYRTGDAVRADPDGYLFLVDRLKDMIISGGENVYSIEVEAALGEHPAVAEAAVFGIPSERWGEAVHAVVSLNPGASASVDELIAHCRALIAGYKTPRSIEVRSDPLPKSGPGKILKAELREPYWEGHLRRVN
jgi:long-chain acyl-CoA synthetase